MLNNNKNQDEQNYIFLTHLHDALWNMFLRMKKCVNSAPEKCSDLIQGFFY